MKELTIYEVLNLPNDTIVKMITEEGYDSQLIKVINQYDTKALVFKSTLKYVPITEIWLNVKYNIVKIEEHYVKMLLNRKKYLENTLEELKLETEGMLFPISFKNMVQEEYNQICEMLNPNE